MLRNLGVWFQGQVDWIGFEKFRFSFPSGTEEFIGCKATQRFDAFGKVISQEECLEMLPELIMRGIVISIDCGFLECTVHPFNLTVCPWMMRACKPVADAMRLANSVKLKFEGVPVTLLVGELDAVVSQYRMDGIGHGSEQLLDEAQHKRIWKSGQLPQTCAAYLVQCALSNVDVEVAYGILLEPCLPGLIAWGVWQPVDPMTLQTPVK